jgi:hypothetical protein
MSRESLPLSNDPRLRTLEGKLALLEEVGRTHPDKAVPLLLEFLCDQSWHVRERAVDALVARGHEVMDALVAMMDEGLWYTRAGAAQALGRIGEVDGLDSLVAHYEDENSTVRRAVASALAALVTRHGTEPIGAAFKRAGVRLEVSRTDGDRRELAQALVKVHADARSGGGSRKDDGETPSGQGDSGGEAGDDQGSSG